MIRVSKRSHRNKLLFLLVIISMSLGIANASVSKGGQDNSPAVPIAEDKSPKIKFSKIKKSDKMAVTQELDEVAVTANELGKVSEQFVQALQNKNTKEFYASLDVEAIVQKSLAGSIQKLDDLKVERDNVIRGIVVIPDILIDKIGTRGHIKYLRLVKRDKAYRGLVRVKFSNGEITYLELIAQKNKKGEVKIVDYFDAMLGRSYTTIVSQMLIKSDTKANTTDKIVIYTSKKLSFHDRYAETIRFYQKGEYKQALDSFQHLPSKFRATKDMLLLRIQIAKATNRNAYREALVLLEQKFSKIPELDLILSDHYFFTKQYPVAINSLEQYSQYIGGDVALENLRVKIFNIQNKFNQAITIGAAAIKEDDSYEDIYWSMLKAYLHSYQYQHVGEILDILVDKFHAKFDIENFYKDPFYREYGFSKQFKKWKEKHNVAIKVEKPKLLKTEPEVNFDDEEE